MPTPDPAAARMAARVTGFGTSIFSEMSRLAREHGAVNLSQGFPDFDSPAWLHAAPPRRDRRRAQPVRDQPRRAPPAPGARRPRRPHYGLTYDVDREITVTSGCTEAIFDMMLALSTPAKRSSPSSRPTTARARRSIMAGGTPRFVRLDAPDWRFDPAALAAAITPRTRVPAPEHARTTPPARSSAAPSWRSSPSSPRRTT